MATVVGLVALAVAAITIPAGAAGSGASGPVRRSGASGAWRRSGASGAWRMRCPARDRNTLRSATPGASRELVPPGADQLLLCRYSGLNQPIPPSELIAYKRIGRGVTVHRLEKELDALTQPTGSMACPADDGSEIVAYFAYRSKPTDPVTVGLTGCQIASNGHVYRLAGPVVPQLESLVGK